MHASFCRLGSEKSKVEKYRNGTKEQRTWPKDKLDKQLPIYLILVIILNKLSSIIFINPKIELILTKPNTTKKQTN